jgi:hypothetical protein
MDTVKEILSYPYLGGISCVLTCLFAYWGKLRLAEYKSQLNTAEATVQALLERSTHVTKAQFDKEFTIYQDIWASLVPLRASTLSLRPAFDSINLNESDQERKSNRLQNFGHAFKAARDLVEQHKPFYATKVYGSLEKIMQLCLKEAVQYKRARADDDEAYWEAQKTNQEAIISAIDQCCELIRTRIAGLAVLE